MKRLAFKILYCLFISMLMMPSVLSRRLQVVNKIVNKGRTPENRNNTVENCNQDVTGIQRAVPWLPQLPPNILINPNQPCYTQFFANGQIPVNLRIATLQNARYICQQLPQQPGIFYYATMHDEGLGIPVYSAYVLHAGNVNFQSRAGVGWIQTPGIQNQGSNQIYQAQQQCHRGHLYPAMTSSGNPANSANSHRSTYQFTNAVPQCGSFNTGQWRIFEGRIRNYAVQTCIPAGGVLYLISGSSFVAIQNTNPPQPIQAQITQFAAGIFKPTSMWTAGMCLFPTGQTQSFAVIGNNVPQPFAMLTQETTQAQLEAILTFDVATNNLKRNRFGRRVHLFPGGGTPKPIKLPEDEYPPTDGSKGSKTPPSPKSPKQPSPQKPSASKSKKPTRFRLG